MRNDAQESPKPGMQALLGHAFDLGKRAGRGKPASGGLESRAYVRLLALWRHPFNSQKRRSFRRNRYLSSTPELLPLLGQKKAAGSTAGAVSSSRISDGVSAQTAESGTLRAEISISRRLADLAAYRREVCQYRDAAIPKSEKTVIYSAISAGYDTIKLPSVLDPRFDYVLFTDSPVPDTGVWQIRPLPLLSADPTRSCRYVKTHPHSLLSEYDCCVWMDANIMITGDIWPMIKTFRESDAEVAAIPHPFRTSVREELEACAGRDETETMLAQVKRYEEEGFEHDDLIETNLMIFRISSPAVQKFLDAWWCEIDRGSKRDQLSVNYALRRAALDWLPLTRWPDSARNHPLLARWPHDGGGGAAGRLAEAVATGTIDPFAGAAFAETREKAIAAQHGRSIDIVVCVHNALHDTRACLESIARFRRVDKQRLILVDDGSGDATREYMEAFASERSWATIIRHDQAVGYTKAANAGLAASTGDLVVLLNSDTIVTDGWAEKMADAVFSTAGAGMVGPLSNAASYQSIPDHRSTQFQTAVNELPPGLTPDDINAFCEGHTVRGVLPLVPILHGFCLGFTREIIEKVGLFDEQNFAKGYGEENDYCLRATDAGFSLVVAMHTFIYHGKSKSYMDDVRVKLVETAGSTLRRLHGKERVERAVKTLEANPVLTERRSRAADLFASVPWLSQDLLSRSRSARTGSLTSIVMCTHGQVNATARSLRSLSEHDAGADFELLLVDNGSNPKDAEQLGLLVEQYPFARLVVNRGNFNLSAGRNQGCLRSSGTNLVFLSNGAEVSQQWLSELLKPLSDSRVKGSQARLLGPDGTVNCAGIVFSDRSPMGYRLYAGQPGNYGPALRPRALAALCADCLAVRAEDFAEAGGFDVNFLNDQEDIDLCLRMGGCESVFRYAPNAVVIHHDVPAPERARNVEANRRLFFERWSGSIRPDDMLHYADDDVVATEYAPDQERWVNVGYAVWGPKQLRIQEDALQPAE